MGELFDALPVLLVLWVLLSGLFGRKGGKQRPPGGRRPASRTPTARHPSEREPMASTRTGPEGGGSAVDVLPEDLWAILTGERRAPSPLPVPRGEPRSGAEEDFEEEAGRLEGEAGFAWDVENEAGADEDVARSADGGGRTFRRAEEEARSLEVIPPPDYSAVISLEKPPPAPAQRHAAFHARLAESPRRTAAARRPRLPRALAGRSRLQQAVILRDVLGPPRGLE